MEKTLMKYGIDVPKHTIVYNIYDIDKISIKYPVVVKVISKDIIHKSDIGGVINNIYTREALKDAIKKIQENIHTSQPQVLIEGFRVEEQISGVEFFLGSKVDNAFGLVGAIGSGGIYVEIYRDVVFFLPDHIKSKHDVIKLLVKTKIGKEIIEKGSIRGTKININALTKTIISFAKILRNETITNLEINPLICNDRRCVACDVRKV